MKDIPIIASSRMVKALLSGHKTMTRRHAWRNARLASAGMPPTPWQRVQPGDRLWVRESFFTADTKVVSTLGIQQEPIAWLSYRADETHSLLGLPSRKVRWRPSIHMPRWASRLTLVVTATKLEHLQDISVEDVFAEGACRPEQVRGASDLEVRGIFREWWEDLHGLVSWEYDTEVVALSFQVHKCNVDAHPCEASGGEIRRRMVFP